MANILVCDDDKDIVEAIGIYLEQEGYTVIKAYDGVEAINVLRSQPVDLLIIDIMMPKLDGIRATLKIREENPLPIIILSAKSEDADKILGLNVGADDGTGGKGEITASKIYKAGSSNTCGECSYLRDRRSEHKR